MTPPAGTVTRRRRVVAVPGNGAGPAAPRAEWPLLDRSAALPDLPSEPREGAGLLIVGDAGAGKTTLLTMLADRHRSGGHFVVKVNGSSAFRSIPLAPFLHLGLDPAGGLHELLSRIWRHLDEEAAGRALVVIADDAHHLDDPSAALLQQLAAFGSATLFVAQRTGERLPEPLHALRKDGLCDRVELPHLTRDEVDQLVHLALGGQVDGATTHELWRVTGGNALFLRELVRHGLESGSLVERGNVWTWNGRLENASRLNELVAARLDALSEVEQNALRVVALAEPIEVSLLAELIDLATVESLERQRLIVVTDGPQAALRSNHALFAEVLRSSTSQLEAQKWLRALAEALERLRPGHRADALRVLAWRRETREASDPALLMAAAAWLQPVDADGALDLAERAVAGGAGPAGDVLLADLLAARGRPAEAEDRLAALAAAHPDTDAAALVAAARAELALCDLGDPERAGILLDLAHAELTDAPLTDAPLTDGHLTDGPLADARPTGPGGRAELIALRAVMAAGEATTQTPTVGADRLPANATSSCERAELWAAAAELTALQRRGEWATLWLATDYWQSRLEAGDAQSSTAAAHARVALCSADLWRAGPAAARTRAEADYERAITSRDRAAQGPAALAVGELLLFEGVVDESIWCLREARLTLDRARDLLPRCLDGLAIALSLAGEIDLARAALADWEGLSVQGADRIRHVRAQAGVAAARGAVGEARQLLIGAAEEAARHGDRSELVLVAYELARMGDDRRARRWVADHVLRGGSALCDLLADHIDALGGRRPHTLTEVGSRLARSGLLRFAAEAELAAAERFAAEGQRSAAAACHNRAAGLIRECGPLHLGVEPRFSAALNLTRREREIAELVVEGLRDRDIAERLFLSVRTVQTHLFRVYCKLGVHDRTGLRDVIGR